MEQIRRLCVSFKDQDWTLKSQTFCDFLCIHPVVHLAELNLPLTALTAEAAVFTITPSIVQAVCVPNDSLLTYN